MLVHTVSMFYGESPLRSAIILCLQCIDNIAADLEHYQIKVNPGDPAHLLYVIHFLTKLAIWC